MEKLNYSEVVQSILQHHVTNRLNSQTEVHLIKDPYKRKFTEFAVG
jgi:hypothetical protein